jgi:hypothetical protein
MRYWFDKFSSFYRMQSKALQLHAYFNMSNSCLLSFYLGALTRCPLQVLAAGSTQHP